MKKLFTWTAAMVAVAVAATAARPAAAGEQQELIDKARYTAERMLQDPDYSTMQRMLRDAKGVLIIPNLLKGGFFFGAEGGTGVLLGRTATGWSYPAFYTMGGASFGLQIGAEAAEIMLLIMNEDALQAVISNQVKLGADASVAVGPIGAGVDAGVTTNLAADIYTFSKAKGLYGGITVEGNVVAGRTSMNEQYYGTGATARAVVIEDRFQNPGADGLRATLAPY